MAKKETPHQIVIDIELNDKTKILEANQKLANKLGYKDIYALEENETKPTIEQIRNAQEIAKEIKEIKQDVIDTISVSHEVTKEEVNYKLIKRIWQSILRLFAPLFQEVIMTADVLVEINKLDKTFTYNILNDIL